MRIGKVTESVLKRSVLKLIKSDSNRESAAAKSDCAYSIDEDGSVLLSSVSTMTVKTDEAGFFAVHNAANNVFCMGGKPTMAVLNILLAADAEESELKNVMRSAIKAANDLGIAIEGGHTEVTDAVERTVVSAIVTGISKAKSNSKALEKDDKTFLNNIEGKLKDSCDIIITKWIALEGTAILAANEADKLKGRLPDYMIKEAAGYKRLVSVKNDARIALSSGALMTHDVSMGGIFAALWDISERAGCGMEVDLKKIPIRQETVEITNYLGLNPYQMISGGSLLIIAPDGDRVVRSLEDAGINATIIGVTTNKNDKIIRNEDEIRYLDKPMADEILKINNY